VSLAIEHHHHAFGDILDGINLGSEAGQRKRSKGCAYGQPKVDSSTGRAREHRLSLRSWEMGRFEGLKFQRGDWKGGVEGLTR
jgi:hypothetical protein